MDAAINSINGANVADEVDWDKITKIVSERSGNAEDITLFPLYSSRQR